MLLVMVRACWWPVAGGLWPGSLLATSHQATGFGLLAS